MQAGRGNLPPRPELRIRPPAPSTSESIPVAKKSLISRLFPSFFMLAAAGGLAALGWFAYMERKKPVSITELPVVQADKTPHKIKPEDPGGMDIPDRDKQIYAAISDVQAKEPIKIEDLLPPPEEPVAREDLVKEVDNIILPKEAEQVKVKELDVAKTAKAESTKQDIETTITKIKDAEIKDIVPDMPPLPEGGVKKAEETMVKQVQEVAVVPPVVKKEESVKPAEIQKKAENKVVKKKVEVPLEPAKVKKTETKKKVVAKKPATKSVKKFSPVRQLPASMRNKGYRVQLGSYRDMKAFNKSWKRFQQKHPKELGKLVSAVEKINLGSKGTFYRLQAGHIAREADARRLCKSLIGKKQDCLVIKPGK